MTTVFIIITILVGIILILVEIFFIPGTTVVGIIGGLVIAGGIWATYNKFGPIAGHITLGSTVVFCVVMIIISFRAGTWNLISQKSVIDSRVNEDVLTELKIGEEGMTISALRPMGTAVFQDEYFEVSTLGSFIGPKTKVRIIQISGKNREIVVEEV